MVRTKVCAKRLPGMIVPVVIYWYDKCSRTPREITHHVKHSLTDMWCSWRQPIISPRYCHPCFNCVCEGEFVDSHPTVPFTQVWPLPELCRLLPTENSSGQTLIGGAATSEWASSVIPPAVTSLPVSASPWAVLDESLPTHTRSLIRKHTHRVSFKHRNRAPHRGRGFAFLLQLFLSFFCSCFSTMNHVYFLLWICTLLI